MDDSPAVLAATKNADRAIWKRALRVHMMLRPAGRVVKAREIGRFGWRAIVTGGVRGTSINVSKWVLTNVRVSGSGGKMYYPNE
jgi:hypothetical protein